MSFSPCGHWNLRDMYGILRSLGHLDISMFVSCDFPKKVTSQEIWLSGRVTSGESWLPRKVDFPGRLTSREGHSYVWKCQLAQWVPLAADGNLGKWPYNPCFRLKQGCFGQHNIRINLEHPQMNIRCIAAAGSWRRTFASCFTRVFIMGFSGWISRRGIVKMALIATPNMVSLFQSCHKNWFSWEWPVFNWTSTPLPSQVSISTCMVE